MASTPHPFINFNFSIEIKVEGVADDDLVCKAQFSECDGLELTMDVKTIREGGGNNREIHLAGPISYSELTLRRGMTADLHLWQWFNAVVKDPSLRSDATIVMFGADGETVQATFTLSRCLPLKLKAPSLSAGEGGIAVEEFQLGYEHFTIEGLTNETAEQGSSS